MLNKAYSSCSCYSLFWCSLSHPFKNKLSVPIAAFTKIDKYQHHSWNTDALQQLSYNLCVGVITHRDLSTLLIAIEGSKLVSKHIKMPQRTFSTLHNQDLVIWAALLELVENFVLLCVCVRVRACTRVWKLAPTFISWLR